MELWQGKEFLGEVLYLLDEFGDKIDAIGAVGIARAYLFAGELGARLHNPLAFFQSWSASRPFPRASISPM